MRHAVQGVVTRMASKQSCRVGRFHAFSTIFIGHTPVQLSASWLRGRCRLHGSTHQQWGPTATRPLPGSATQLTQVNAAFWDTVLCDVRVDR